MRVAIAQLNQVVGDLSGNAARILETAAEARRGGAQLLVTPEL
jgi:NAD+ synthase (glutamine-hydrolysing)